MDAAVIGGGVAGLAVARELAGRGLRVALVERGRLGAEASHAAGGMLAPQSEADGDDVFFRLQCASRDLYPAFAEALREETGLDVELDRTGTLYVGFDAHDEAELERRYAWQARAGLAVERLTGEEARELEPELSGRVRLALRFPRDWQVENRRLLAALASSVEARGVRVITETEVTGVRVERGHVRGVETSRGFVAAGAVVLAAGAWSSLVIPASTRRPAVEPVRGQMLCFEARPPLCTHVIYSPRGYLVPRRDGRLLAGSTTEHAGFEKHVTAEGLRAMSEHALEMAPKVGRLPFVEAWAGLRPRAADSWPLLGEDEETRGLFYATAHYRNGILLAPLTAQLIADLLAGDTRAPHALEAFSPARFHRAAVAPSQAR